MTFFSEVRSHTRNGSFFATQQNLCVTGLDTHNAIAHFESTPACCSLDLVEPDSGKSRLASNSVKLVNHLQRGKINPTTKQFFDIRDSFECFNPIS